MGDIAPSRLPTPTTAKPPTEILASPRRSEQGAGSRGRGGAAFGPALPRDRAMRAECGMQPEAVRVSSTYSQTQRSTCPGRLSYGCSGSYNLACCAFKNLHPNAALI